MGTVIKQDEEAPRIENIIHPLQKSVPLKLLPGSQSPPQSPLIFFINLCHFFLYIPFRVKWSPSNNRFILLNNKLQKFLCGIFHALVVLYNITVLTDHFLNFKKLTGSFVSAGFIFVNVSASAVVWLLFMKLVWFHRSFFENLVNFTADHCRNCQHKKAMKFCIIGMGIIYTYFNIELVGVIIKRSEKTDDLPINCFIFKLFSFWPLAKWILMVVQAHVLQFYFVKHGLFLALSCHVLLMAWDFEKDLSYFEAHNVEMVISNKM